jgi:hypothetical protein
VWSSPGSMHSSAFDSERSEPGANPFLPYGVSAVFTSLVAASTCVYS